MISPVSFSWSEKVCLRSAPPHSNLSTSGFSKSDIRRRITAKRKIVMWYLGLGLGTRGLLKVTKGKKSPKDQISFIKSHNNLEFLGWPYNLAIAWSRKDRKGLISIIYWYHGKSNNIDIIFSNTYYTGITHCSYLLTYCTCKTCYKLCNRAFSTDQQAQKN